MSKTKSKYEKLTEVELRILLRAIDRDVSASLRNGCWDNLSDYIIYVYKNDQFIFDSDIIIELEKIIKRFQSTKEILIALKNVTAKRKELLVINPDSYFGQIYTRKNNDRATSKWAEIEANKILQNSGEVKKPE
jgi:hypothetical protein